MPQAALVIGAVAAVGGTAFSMIQQSKAAKARRRQERNANRRSRRQALREAQIKRAQAFNIANQFGAGQSSAVGGIGAVTSQAGEAVGFASQQGALSNIISKSTELAGIGSGVAGLGMQAMQFGLSQGGSFDKLFQSSPSAATKAPLTYNFNRAY